MLCPKCKKEMEVVRIDNHFGTFVKIMQCPKCRSIESSLPDKIDQEIYDG